MSAITFSLVNGAYESDVLTLNADTAFHIERDGIGNVELFQRSTATGAFVPVRDRVDGTTSAVDFDYIAGVYPKYVKIVSQSEVVSAYMS